VKRWRVRKREIRGEDLLIIVFICRDCWDDEIEQRAIGFSKQSSGSTLGCSYGQTCILKNQGFPIGQGRKQEAGGRRQEAGSGKQEIGVRRQEAFKNSF